MACGQRGPTLAGDGGRQGRWPATREGVGVGSGCGGGGRGRPICIRGRRPPIPVFARRPPSARSAAPRPPNRVARRRHSGAKQLPHLVDARSCAGSGGPVGFPLGGEILVGHQAEHGPLELPLNRPHLEGRVTGTREIGMALGRAGRGAISWPPPSWSASARCSDPHRMQSSSTTRDRPGACATGHRCGSRRASALALGRPSGLRLTLLPPYCRSCPGQP